MVVVQKPGEDWLTAWCRYARSWPTMNCTQVGRHELMRAYYYDPYFHYMVELVGHLCWWIAEWFKWADVSAPRT